MIPRNLAQQSLDMSSVATVTVVVIPAISPSDSPSPVGMLSFGKGGEPDSDSGHQVTPRGKRRGALARRDVAFSGLSKLGVVGAGDRVLPLLRSMG